MKPSFICGIIFGILTILINVYLILPTRNNTLGLILISGLLFFNILFTTLFTKKANGYNLAMTDGIKAAVQTGIIQSLFYFLSIYLIRNYICPDFFPGLDTFRQYSFNLSIYIIGFSIFSIIFGLITSSLFHNKT
jgi:hypothetical protein